MGPRNRGSLNLVSKLSNSFLDTPWSISALSSRLREASNGPQDGLWFWTMTAVRPGPRLPHPTKGTEARRDDAGRRVVEAYERLLKCNA